MIDIKALEKNDNDYQIRYRECLKARGGDTQAVDHLLSVNARRKSVIAEFELKRAEQNRVGEEIAKLKRAKKDASSLLAQMLELSEKLKELDHKKSEVEKELESLLLVLPNHFHDSVPFGTSENDNKVVRQIGEPKKFSFKAKDHVDLGENLNLIDFERAGKVAGARFAYLRNGAAELERALIQLMLDLHTREHGYEEVVPPFIVNTQSYIGTGQFPKFKDDVFHLEGTDYHLASTAEIPLTNFFANEVLNGSDLPKYLTAYTPCFRSEAGSHGRDTRGLIRQHQFNKVELVKFTHPDESYHELEKLTSDAEKILQILEIPYRVMCLSTADLGFGAAKTYDLEVWLPGQNAYREISSCSNCEDFQARRANIRFKPTPKDKPQFVHTLNGSGLAVGRTLIAIFENYQQEDGRIHIPQALHKYMSRTVLG